MENKDIRRIIRFREFDHSLTYYFHKDGKIIENYYSCEEGLWEKEFITDRDKEVSMDVFRRILLNKRVLNFASKCRDWHYKNHPEQKFYGTPAKMMMEIIFSEMQKAGVKYNKTLAAEFIKQELEKEASENAYLEKVKAKVNKFIEEAVVLKKEGLIKSFTTNYRNDPKAIEIVHMWDAKYEVNCMATPSLRYEVEKRIETHTAYINRQKVIETKRNELIRQGIYCIVDGVQYKCERGVLRVPDYAMGHLIGAGGRNIKAAQKEFGYFRLEKIVTNENPRKVRAEWV